MSTPCAFCEQPTDREPLRLRRSVLTFRDPVTDEEREAQMPREVVLCDRCSRDQSLLAGCPRCRRYGRFRPYGQAPYGTACTECGGELWPISGAPMVR